jgi:hypothetical protein
MDEWLTFLVVILLSALILIGLASVFIVVCNSGGRMKATITSVSQV